MVFTYLGFASIILNIVFLVIITLLIRKYFKQKKQLRGVISELDNESLEHFLKEIRKRGFDVTVKPQKTKKS